MAITHVASGIVTGTGSTSVGLTASFSGLGVQPDDLVIAVVLVGSVGDISSDITTSGYTPFEAEMFVNDTYDTNINYGYKFMGATPDSDVSCGPSTSTSFAQVLMYSIYRGVDTTTPMDVTFWRGNSINRMLPAWAATITPVTDGAVIVAMAGGAHNLGATNGVYSQGGDLTNFVSDSGDSTRDITGGLGHYNWTTADGAWSPAAWSIPGTDSTSFSYFSALVALRPASGGAYTLDAGVGSIAVTGQSAALTRALLLALGAGSFGVTGQSATPTRQLTLDAGVGTIGLAGQTMTAVRALLIQADAGSFSQSGQTSSPLRALLMAADLGTFSVLGFDATVSSAANIAAATGSFGITGYSVTLTRALLLDAGAGSFAITGKDLTIATANTITVDTGSFAVSGGALTITRQLILALGVGSFSETGLSLAVARGLVLAAGAGSFGLTGNSLGTARALLVQAGAGAIGLTGYSAAITSNAAALHYAFPGDGPNIVTLFTSQNSVEILDQNSVTLDGSSNIAT